MYRITLSNLRLASVFSKLRKALIYDPDYPGPPLAKDEVEIRKDVVPLVVGLGGARLGTLKLTSSRLIWYETVSPWPLKRISGEIGLDEIISVTRTGLIDSIFGARRLRLRLRSGRVRRLRVGEGRIEEWIASISGALRIVTQCRVADHIRRGSRQHIWIS